MLDTSLIRTAPGARVVRPSSPKGRKTAQTKAAQVRPAPEAAHSKLGPDCNGQSSGQSEERYRLLLLLSPDANFVHVDGLITFVNQAFCRLMGASAPDELVGRPALSVVQEGNKEFARLRLARVLANEHVDMAEMRFVRLDGRPIDVEENSVALALHGRVEVQVVVRDISARRQAVTALLESEERFKFVARAVSDVVWDWNLIADTLWWNDGFLTTFGFAAGEIEPTVASWTGRIHDDDRNRVMRGIRDAIASDAETWESEYRFERKDGSHAFVQDRGFILRDASGAGIRMVGGMRDLTAQKKMEAEFLRAQRMESIGTLAGGIAHDLNNVLAPIMMSIELLQLEDINSTRNAKVLEIIQASSRRGADLVRQVLTFARGIEGKRMTVQLGPLIEDLEGIVNGTFPRNIQPVITSPRILWTVTGDSSQLHQVLLNLVVNARDAMPHGGTLTVSATNFVVDSQYAGTSPEAKVGKYVLLEVADTGEGMSAAVRERIFEPFFTTKELGKGSGIGLATVHTVVKSHSGFIVVDSVIGRGTSFKVFLPADVGNQASPTLNPFPAEMPRGNGELVLVIEDEISIRKITQQTLESFGYRVITAGDGAQGVAFYAAQPAAIALVLTDMMMPVLDGETTIRVLARINPLVRVIAVSGLEVPETLAKAAKAGARDFLPKPYTAATLLRKIRLVLDREAVVVANAA